MLSNPWIKRIAGALVVLLVAFFGWRMLADRGGPAVSFETGVIDKGTVEKSISSTGSVAALVTVLMSDQSCSRRGARRLQHRGQKNDLLAVIDPRPTSRA